MAKKTYCKEVEIAGEYDVIVVGGGPAGIAAAIASGRSGNRTLLLEASGCVGGTGTIGGLPFWLGATTGSIPYLKMLEKNLNYKDLPHPRKAVGGIFEEAMQVLRSKCAGVGPAVMAQTDQFPGLDRLGCHDEFTYDMEAGKRELEQMILSSGAEILYFTNLVDAAAEGGRVEGVFAANKNGISFYKAKYFIDCSGDADAAARAGFETYKGDRKTGQMTSASLVIHIENVDSAAVEKYLNDGNDPWLRQYCKMAQEKYPEAGFNDNIIMFPMIQKGVFMVNGGTAFHFVDGSSAEDLSMIMQKGRVRANDLVEKLFRPYVPGFENARLRLTAYYPGIRETRRIVGEYVLTEEDVLQGKKFNDVIAIGGRHFDLGRVEKRTDGSYEYKQPFHDKDLSVANGFMCIPYRCLIPKGSKNLICAGRCVSADGQTMGPARIMSTCFAMGEAAGWASGLAVKSNIDFLDVDKQALREKIKNNNGIVD